MRITSGKNPIATNKKRHAGQAAFRLLNAGLE
jgi:hypothetical protein